jgi:D-galactarolactone cycloisomerase
MTRRQFGLVSAGSLPVISLAQAKPTGMKPFKITRLHTIEVRNVATGKGLVLPWDPQKIPQDTRDYVITQIHTDQGIVGTSMDGDYKLPSGIAKTIQEPAAAYFLGKDPFDLELHNQAFFQKTKLPVRTFYLEVALWDIIGQALGLPLYKLWGAHSTKVKPYAATVHFDRTAEQRAEDALKFYELGFRAIKLRLHNEKYEDDIRLPRTVIDAVRGKMDVMVDANQAHKKAGDPPPVWDLERTLRTARQLEDMGLYWLEEPLNRYDYDNLARVRGSLKRMHLAGAEGNVGIGDFATMLAKRAFSYLQPDPMIGGPVSVIRKIAAMAEGFGVMFGPHHGKSGVGMLANLHMQCAAPNSGYLEYMYDPGFWNPEGFQAGFEAPYPIDKEGYIHAPNKPGLGAPWDRKWFRKYNLHYSG